MVFQIILQTILAVYALVNIFMYAYTDNDPAMFGFIMFLVQTIHIIILDVFELKKKKSSEQPKEYNVWIKKKY